VFGGSLHYEVSGFVTRPILQNVHIRNSTGDYGGGICIESRGLQMVLVQFKGNTANIRGMSKLFE
jgi:ABC-type sulfate transport system substrate-binding protein